MTDFGKPFRNIAKSCLIAAANFDTPPSNLENAIDGDLDNPTGIGETAITGGANCGDIIITLPAAGRYLVGMKADFWGLDWYDMYLYFLDACQGAYGWYSDIAYSGDYEEGCIKNTQMILATGDFRFTFYTSNTDRCRVKIYDISVFKLP